MADSYFGEKFVFGSINEAQHVVDSIDIIISHRGYATVREFLILVMDGNDIIWKGDKDLIDNYGWLDTLGWKIREAGCFYWLLETTDPQQINELGERND